MIALEEKQTVEGNDRVSFILDQIATQISDLRKYVQERSDQIERFVNKMELRITADHDKLVIVEQEVKDQAKTLSSYKEDEKEYGQKFDNRVNMVETDVKKFNAVYWKLFGITACAGVIAGILVRVVPMFKNFLGN